ncbi:hypothetical protein PLICRDRAFT_172039 [Plicaturopsis crispa FD-325 SS-3]|nr:hypothetical protein PLICRDRAFT_172039 [Plicaturopsis crispa FD-325 SS-3]
MLSQRIALRLGRQLKSFARAASSTPTTPTTSAPTVSPSTTSEPTPVPQSPNYATTWSTHQRSRPVAGENPRFEQTFMELQPNPLSAMEMINNEPIRLVAGRKAVCDGGGGALGHPKIFINVDQPGPHPCGYCGIRFEKDPHHHGHGH